MNETPERLILDVRVQPRASRNEIVGYQADGRLKVRITAPPVDGKANTHLFRFLADQFGVPLRQIRLLSGDNNRNKRIEIIAPRHNPLAVDPS